MADSAYAKPLIVRGGTTIPLERIPLTKGSDAPNYSEAYVRDLVFEHPSSLPIAEIDRVYEGLVPICKELLVRPAGSIDALFATRTGRLVVLEAKLWRNPEQRREVIGQILDYAKTLSQWSYEDLKREVAKKLNWTRKEDVLYELVRSAHPDTDESQFVDEVQQSLRRGRFMLLIVGDGIREGAATIANFLETAGSLEFTFGLVEVGLYRVDGIGTLVQPRVIARTVEIKRIVIELPEGAKAVESGAQIAAETEGDDSLSEREQFYCTFWTEFLKQLHFDDATQPIPRPTTIANLYFPMPPSSGTAWVAAFFSQTKRRVGVYLRFLRGAFADAVYARLSEERDAINKESGLELIWEDDRQSIAVRKPVPDVFDPLRRDEIRVFLADAVNRFVNVFRPRLERIVKDLQG